MKSINTNYVEIPFANGYKVIISKGEGVFVALENQNGYIVSDAKLNDEQKEALQNILAMYEK